MLRVRNIVRLVLSVLFVVIAAAHVHAVQIFYESFETPVVAGRELTAPTGWISKTGNYAGLNNATGTISGVTGNQYAFVGRYGGQLTTMNTHLTNALTAHVKYTLSFDLSWYNGTVAISIVELLAGTNVIAATTNLVAVEKDLSAQRVSMSFTALPDHQHINETLGISLRTFYNIHHNQDILFDNMSLEATDTSADTDPPTPTNMVWVGLPTSSVSNSITMHATNAIDDSLVQYYFTNTVNGNVSGWQDSPIWNDTGLTPGVTYSYRVKARDKSANTNETNWSSPLESAECEEHIIFYESFETPSIDSSGELTIGTYPLPPDGWSTAGEGYIWDNTYKPFAQTPFGYQFANVRPEFGTAYLLTTNNMDGHVLEELYTYRVTCNAGVLNLGSGAVNKSPQVSLLAGSTVVASNSVLTTTCDFSETLSLEFIPDAANTNLGKTLNIKLEGFPDFHQDRAVFDNIKVYAIAPPPLGTVIEVR